MGHPPSIAAAVALVAILQPAAEPQCTCPPIRQFPAGVVDESTRTAYVAAVDRGFTAVALDSGKVQWRSEAATLPIGLVPRGVVAIRRAENPRETQVVTVDRRTGAVITTSDAFRLGFDAAGDRALGATLYFTSQDDSVVTVRWREIAPAAGGPERDTGRAVLSGAFTIGKDRAVRLLAPRDAMPVGTAGAGGVYQRGVAHTRDAWSSGGCARTLFLEQRGEQMRLALECNPGPAAIRVPLIEAAALAATVTVDGCHVFVETPSGNASRWTIFSSGSGERVGVISRHPAAWNPAVVGNRAYVLIDGVLHAIDITTGATRWQLPVRSRLRPAVR